MNIVCLDMEEDRDAGEEGAPETIAVLVRDRYQRDAVVTGLAQQGIEVRPVDREAVGRGGGRAGGQRGGCQGQPSGGCYAARRRGKHYCSCAIFGYTKL